MTEETDIQNTEVQEKLDEEEQQTEQIDQQNEPPEQCEENTANEEGTSSDNIDERKLFIGGFAPQTKREEFQEYFSKFGEVQSVRLQVDPRSKKSKGYGFVIFKTPEPIEKIIAEEHMLNNRKITVGKAKLKEGKLFVGGLAANLTKEDIHKHFSQYGNVTDVNIPFNKQTNQPRAYCFVTFESERVVKGLARNPKHLLNNQEVDIQIANSEPSNNDRERQNMRQQNNGYGGGFERSMGPPRRQNIPVWDQGYPPANNYHNDYQNTIPAEIYGWQNYGGGPNRFRPGPRPNNKWGPNNRNNFQRSRPY